MAFRACVFVVFVCFVGYTCGFNVYQYPKDYMEEDDMYYEGYDDLVDRSVMVVSDGVVNNAWANPSGNSDSLMVDKWNSITYFMVEVDGDFAEKFGPPVYRIVGAELKPEENDAEGRSDDVLSVVTTGDACYGNFYENEELFFLNVNYYCLEEGVRTISVTFTIVDVLDKVTNVTFYWKKKCGSGIREGLDIVVSEVPSFDDEQLATVVSNGLTRPHWEFENPTHTLPLSRWEAEFLISLREGYGSQAYSRPEVTCSDDTVLQVRALGEAANSNIVSEIDLFHRLKIVHTCLATEGEAEVSVIFGLGSFEPIKFSWIKSCAGVNSGFFISTESGGEPNVVQNSLTQEQWNHENPLIKIPSTEEFTTFYLKSEGTISFRPPVVTVYPSHVLKASLAGEFAYGGLLVSGEGEIRVDYKCMQRGTATIRFSIPFSEHQHPIEYAWVKECPKFTRRRRIQHPGYMTANRAMLLFCFVTLVITVAVGYAFLNWKKRKAEERKARMRALQS